MVGGLDSELDKLLGNYRTSLDIITNMEYPPEKRKFLKGLYKLYRMDSYVTNLADNCLEGGTAECVGEMDKIMNLELDILYEIVSGNCERTKMFESGSIPEAEYLFERCRSGMAYSNYAKIADRVMDNYIKQSF